MELCVDVIKRQAGRAHDAININWKNDKLTLRSFFAFNQNYLEGNITSGNVNNPKGQFFAPGGQPYQHLEAVHAHYDFAPTQGLSFLVANLGQRNDLIDDNDYNMQTIGFHYRGKSDALRYGAEGYLQTGKSATSKNKDGSITPSKDKQAFLLAALVGYQFTPTFSATLGLDYLVVTTLIAALTKTKFSILSLAPTISSTDSWITSM